MDFFEVISKRRSIRHMIDAEVKEGDLHTMLEAACSAPSATNEQPWHFVVVRNRELIGQMQAMVSAKMDELLEVLTDEHYRMRVKKLRFYCNCFGDAPVVIAVLTRPLVAEVPPDYQRPPYDPGLQSVAAAIAHLHLAATALGYGSCWATGPVEFAGAELEAMLEVKEPWYLVALLPVGVARKWPKPRPRKGLEEIATFIG